MKKLLSLIVSAALLLGMLALAGTGASAESWNGFEYSVDGGVITITGYIGGGGEIEIPAEINALPVKAIGNKAFYRSAIEGITIPGSIESIGNEAFQLSNLKSITIPGNVKSIGNYAFQDCGSLTSVIINYGVESIGIESFRGCWFTEITIPGSVKSIGKSAFYYCSSLLSAVIESGCIGDYAFYNCSSLSSVTLGDGVESIGNDAFRNCPIEEISISGSVKSIGNSAFYKCPIEEISIPGSVKSIGENAFQDCGSLASVTICDGVESIGNYAFYHCPIEEIILPGSLRTLGESAFEGCSSLGSITIPASLREIIWYTFYGCSSLHDVYYAGTGHEWNNMTIGARNDPLNNATKHFSDIGFTTHSLALSGEIGVVFNVTVPSDFSGSVDKVTFSVGKNGSSEMAADSAVYDPETDIYSFTCYTGAYNMADIIYPTLVYTVNNEQKTIPGAPYSAQDYVNYVLGNPGQYTAEEVEAVKAIGDYGYFAQKYLSEYHGFGVGDGEDAKYAEFTSHSTDSYDYGAVMNSIGDLPAYRLPENTETIDNTTFSLDLESETALYLYVTAKNGVEIAGATADISGTRALNVTKRKGNTYKIELPGIKATELGVIFRIDMVDADGETLATASISPLHYAARVLELYGEDGDKTDLCNAVCALINYSLAISSLMGE